MTGAWLRTMVRGLDGDPLGDGAADARADLGFDHLGDGHQEVAELVVVAGPGVDADVVLAFGEGEDGAVVADVECVGCGGAGPGGLPCGLVEARLGGGVVVGDDPVGAGRGAGPAEGVTVVPSGRVMVSVMVAGEMDWFLMVRVAW